MFFPSKRLALGYLALLLPPLVLTLLAFGTLAQVETADMVVGVPLDATPVPTVPPLAQAQALFEEGLAQQEQGNFAAAEEAYLAALAIDATLAPVHGALGSLHVAWGQPAEAIGYYQQAAVLEPQAAEWQRSLGVVQANLGNVAAAIEALETAVSLSPEDAMLLYELGQLYAYEQRYAEARLAFDRVLTLATDPLLAEDAAEQLLLLP